MSSPNGAACHLHRVPTGADWERCAEVMSRHGRTFWFASRFLPQEKRRAAQAAYAFCRIGDDIVDRAMEGMPMAEVRAALDRWKHQLDRPTDPVAVAFMAVRQEYGIPRETVLDLFTGLEMDLAPARFPSWDALERYCYHVAGTVGLIVAPILGCREEAALPHAVQLGNAMQLTNILRDVAEDAALGRLYLPLDDLQRYGVDPESVFAGNPTGDFRGLMQCEIARARDLYAASHEGVPALDLSGQVATLASGQLYARILDQIEEQDYDVFRGRVHVSTSRKLRQLPAVMRTLAVTRYPALTRLPLG
ncbi:MAG: phytoene/squalene synthase family protein [Thermomicrobiales bacterium]